MQYGFAKSMSGIYTRMAAEPPIRIFRACGRGDVMEKKKPRHWAHEVAICANRTRIGY